MRLYILRHGQTALNKERRLQGRMQTELNDIGIEQAKALRDILKTKNIEFDKIFCSPLERAIRTGEIATGRKRDEFEIVDELSEISFGVNEGCKYDDIKEAHGNIFSMPESYIPPKGGESLEELQARTVDFLFRMKKAAISGNVLAVSHGTAIHSMLIYLRGQEFKDLWSEHVGNCNLTAIDINQDGFKIRDDLQISIDRIIK